jgi:hypothetical protein
MQAEAKLLPGEVAEVRTRIDEWRKVRRGGSKMPEDLWGEAVALARHFGIHPVSNALGVSYTRLRKRLGKGAPGKTVPPRTEFVELAGGQMLSGSASGASEKRMPEVVIEVSPGRLTIRLGVGSAELVRAFQG